MASLPLKLLLGIHLAPLDAPRASVDVGLPSWSADILDAAWSGVIKDLLNFFEGFLASLREQEEHVEEHCNAEDAEDNVDFPSDVGECWWHKVSQSEVECPEREVSRCHRVGRLDTLLTSWLK